MNAPEIEISPVEMIICQNCKKELMVRIAFIHEEENVFFKWALQVFECCHCKAVMMTEDQEIVKDKIGFTFDCDHCGNANMYSDECMPESISCGICFNEYQIVLPNHVAKYYAALKGL